MEGEFPWEELRLDFSKEDVSEVVRKIREDRGFSTGQFSGTLDVAKSHIEKCERNSAHSCAYLYEILSAYDNLTAKIIIKNGNQENHR